MAIESLLRPDVALRLARLYSGKTLAKEVSLAPFSVWLTSASIAESLPSHATRCGNWLLWPSNDR